MEAGRNQTQNSGNSGNVRINFGGEHKEGYYTGSATNMTRLFIMCNVVWAIVFGLFAYFEGVKMGNLENRVAVLEVYHKK